MPNDPQSLPIPLLNRGIVLKREIGALQPGEYYALSNVTSFQEGALQVRLGSKRFNNGGGIGVIHTIAKMALGGVDASDPRYIGVGSVIIRVTGPYTTYTFVATGFSLSVDRWEAAPYNAGTSGKPTLYIAHDSFMLRDDSTFTKLRRWGIPPPVAVAVCGLADPSLTNYPGFVLLTNQSTGVDRLTGQTVSSSTVVNGSYYEITPTSMAGIYPGMYVKLLLGGVPGYVVVDAVTATTFFAFCSGVPTGTLQSFYNTVNTPGAPHADGTTYYQDFAAAVDWSFGGVADNGYDTDDNVHFGLFVSDYADVSEIRIRVFVNSSTTDYYEKAVTPPQTLAFAQGTQTATTAQIDRAAKITAANLGQTSFPDEITPDLQPVEAQTQNQAIWAEYDISKLDFLKVGNAGQGPLSWKKVTSLRVAVMTKVVGGSPAFTVNVGAIYAIGGQGPDSQATPLATAYDYLFTFRDQATGAEGNPGAAMMPEFAVDTKRRAVQVQCWGTDTADVSGDPSLVGFGSIAVYRRGGTIADGDYHFVGYTTNPGVDGGGVPMPVVFIDNQPDFEIAGNKILEFDNFMPVPGDLPVPFTATIATIGAFVGPAIYSVTFSNLPGGATNLTLFLKPGSQLTLGKGTNQEVALAQSVAAGTVGIYLQRAHFAGEACESDVLPASPCDIVCQVGDALLCAGDKNNPHKVYRSKAGRPHAFPVVNEATGNAHILNIGSPSNPINGLVEFNGEIVSLNRTKLYVFTVWSGAMTKPAETAASRGMIGKHLWCRVDDSIWYMSYDGIYSWAGGNCISMTEPIRFIFDQTQTIENGLQPLDFSRLDVVHLSYYSKYVYVTYIDIAGNYQALRCSILDGHRWELFEYLGTANTFGALTTMFTEADTGRFIGGVYDNNLGQSYLTQLELGSSDAWTAVPTDGTGIPWSAQTGFYPMDKRDLSKLFTDVIIELENPNDTVVVKALYDYSVTPDVNDQFTITAVAGRRFIPLPLQQTGVPKTSGGKEAKVIGFLISGTSTGKVVLYSLAVKWKPLAEIQRGRIEDWDDIGHPHDKRLYEVVIEGNILSNVSVLLNLDIKTGIGGGLESLAVQTITLPGGGRFKETFPIIDGLVVKLVRLRPVVPSADFQVFNVGWLKEPYPPDISNFSESTDKGSPFLKYWQQLIMTVNTNGQTVPVKIEVDGVVVQTINVNTTLATKSVTLTLTPAVKGRRARWLLGTVPVGGMFQVFWDDWVVLPADPGPVNHTFPFQDLGHRWDKRLKTLVLHYNTGGTSTVMQMDIIGPDGVTLQANVQQFTLSGSGESQPSFAISDNVVCKLVRIFPLTDNVTFQLWDPQWDFETYPADTIISTEWNDFGYEHLKYGQQVILDINTGGVACAISVQNENGAVQSLTVTSTLTTRDQILTLSPQLAGKKWRLLFTPGGGGKAQLWSWKIGFTRADAGPVEHSWDWDDLAWPYQKRLLDVTLHWDNGGTPFTVLMDTIGGDGTTINPAVQSFILGGTGRAKKTFVFPVDLFATMVRLYPQSTITTLREWKYVFKKEDLPPDSIPATEWENLGWACEKVFRSVTVDIDTGNVACAIALQVDGVTTQTFSVTTTSLDRVRILTINPDTIGKNVRLVFTPGASGKAQFYGKTFDFWREPCAVTTFDTYELILGAEGWRYLKQIFLEYICPSTVTFTIFRDGGTQFYQTILPTHALRDVERFFLPSINGTVLNKSKKYRFRLTSSSPFKIYGNGSRVESKLLSNDQRQCYEQHMLWEHISPQET